MLTSKHAKDMYLRSRALNEYVVNIYSMISDMREHLEDPHVFRTVRHQVLHLRNFLKGRLSPVHEIDTYVMSPGHGVRMGLSKDQVFVNHERGPLEVYFELFEDFEKGWHPLGDFLEHCEAIQQLTSSEVCVPDQLEGFQECVRKTQQACVRMVQEIASNRAQPVLLRLRAQVEVLRCSFTPIRQEGESIMIDELLMGDFGIRIRYTRNDAIWDTQAPDDISTKLDLAVNSLLESYEEPVSPSSRVFQSK